MNGLLARLRARTRSEVGLTLVELLVAATLSTLLGSMLMASVFSSARAVTANQQSADLTQEARSTLERMTRELREAKLISSVTNPAGPGYVAGADTSLTFEADFNGDGNIQANAIDPEVLTYTFDNASHRLLLLAAGQVAPVLTGGVQSLTLTFLGKGQPWQSYDANLATGNNNGVLDVELAFIDTVQIELVMSSSGHTQRFTTTVDLRNNTH